MPKNIESGEQSEVVDENVEKAKEILGNVYSPEEMEKILSSINPDAFDSLANVRSSTNPAQRRKYLNEWLKQNKKDEEGE